MDKDTPKLWSTFNNYTTQFKMGYPLYILFVFVTNHFTHFIQLLHSIIERDC